MHIHILELAKQKLETNKNVKVVGGFISPSHDWYVAKKLQEQAMKSIHRIAMANIAITHSEWISVMSWESSYNQLIDFYQVTRHLDIILKKTFTNHTLKVTFVCGADLIPRCADMESVEEYPLIAVGRTGSTPYVNKIIETHNDSKLQFIPINTEDISSTMLRDMLASGLSIDHLSFTGVTNYIAKNIADLYLTEEAIAKLIMQNH